MFPQKKPSQASSLSWPSHLPLCGFSVSIHCFSGQPQRKIRAGIFFSSQIVLRVSQLYLSLALHAFPSVLWSWQVAFSRGALWIPHICFISEHFKRIAVKTATGLNVHGVRFFFYHLLMFCLTLSRIVHSDSAMRKTSNFLVSCWYV